jgi:hypothetical protein
LRAIKCPACRLAAVFSRHGSYSKYYYALLIRVLRVRCSSCKVTHALMPTFSLPGASIGTEEAEQYLLARAEGTGRGAASVDLRRRGVSSRYPKQLDRMFVRAISRAKALFPDATDVRATPMNWVRSVVGPTERPLVALNRFCLEGGYNCVCFCRSSVIRFNRGKSGSGSSHNRGSPAR